VNLIIVSLNVAIASIATLLCVLGLSTLKTIKHLNVGKPFWIPVFVSGLFFLISSITTVLNEAVFSLTSINEIAQIAQLTALCSLSVGIYGYFKRIRTNLSRRIVIPEPVTATDDEIEEEIIPESIKRQKEKMKVQIAPTPSVDKETGPSKSMRIEAASGCNHEFGYLRTFPIDADLPEECLSCIKVIECKRS
jgi:hypothetical protein